MSRRVSNDTLIIAGALVFGLLSLAVPFSILLYAPDSEHAGKARPKVEVHSTLVRNPRSADLKEERLAFSGGCGVGEFKDGREIQATIMRQLATYRLEGLSVDVTPACIAVLRGEVRNSHERKEAIRAAGHPWIRAIDIAGLKVLDAADEAPQR